MMYCGSISLHFLCSPRLSVRRNTPLGTVEPTRVSLNPVTGRISHVLVLCVPYVSWPVLSNGSFTDSACSIVSCLTVSHMKFLGLNEMFV